MRARVELAQVVGRDREHAARPARGVEQRAHDAGGPQGVVVLDEQEVDHQPDDLARREVLAGGLVGCLREAADQLLVEVAHLGVADRVGVEVDLGHLGDHEVEQLRAVEPADLGVEVELLDDLAGVGVEGRDPGAQVAGDLGRVGEDGLEGQAAGVVDAEPGDGAEDHADVLDVGGREALEDLGLGGLEDAVEPAQHDEREDDAAVLGLLVVTAEQVGDRPDRGPRGC